MNNAQYKISIVGAGVAGLVAAIVLEEHGFKPVIFEATDSVGGRVKTDIVEGWQLDHGFQVLLTAYPAAQKYLDFDALELQEFLPGAAIFKQGQKKVIGDPLRALNLLVPTLIANIGTFGDKLKILKLNKLLKAKRLDEIFESEEKTTKSYLEEFGFSSSMIDDFFGPFFTGIFLEPNLDTSSRMFEFVYKMFGQGLATLPEAGIGAIPLQLSQRLKSTQIHFNEKITQADGSKIVRADGTEVESDFTILTTDMDLATEKSEGLMSKWKGVDTLYFEVGRRVIDKPLIGLLPQTKGLVNNIFYHTSLKTKRSGKGELLSVTIVKEHNFETDTLVEEVTKELSELCGIDDIKFLKRYRIPMALPHLSDLKYQKAASELTPENNLFMAGDIQLNGSLNAAMLSGETAAMGIINAAKSKADT